MSEVANVHSDSCQFSAFERKHEAVLSLYLFQKALTFQYIEFFIPQSKYRQVIGPSETSCFLRNLNTTNTRFPLTRPENSTFLEFVSFFILKSTQ